MIGSWTSIMDKRTTTIQQIESLIEIIEEQSFEQVNDQISHLEKLLEISYKSDHLYGQAIAHIYMAQVYQKEENTKFYKYHLQCAEALAKRKDYFDVLMIYYKLRGYDCYEQSDELSAITMYLKGAKIAIEIEDKRSCAIFYNNIAEIFYLNEGYSEAKSFYLKALDVLENVNPELIKLHKKIIYINLVFVCCRLQEVDQAKVYLSNAQTIESANATVLLMEICVEIYTYFYDNDEVNGNQAIEKIMKALEIGSYSLEELQSTYIYLLEILILFKSQKYATICMEIVYKQYGTAKPNVRMRIEKLNLLYHKVFQTDKEEHYVNFYQYATQYEEINKKYMIDSFDSYVSLYEARKEQKRILKEQENLQNAVDRDELTQLYNRRYMAKLFTKFKQSQDITSLAYVRIDVDFFKEYNDYYGHAQGDDALRSIAQILKLQEHNNIYASRYGGDEFDCLLVNVTRDDLVLFIKHIQEDMLEANIAHVKSRNTSTLILTLTIGAYYEEDMKTFSEDFVMKKADDALYQAKKEGRNTFVILDRT